MRHKRILDVAAGHPDAFLNEIAQEVPSATTDLVETVLVEYGHPVADDGTDSQPPIQWDGRGYRAR